MSEGKSENTAVSYQYDLAHFEAFFKQDMAALAQEDIRAYVRSLAQEGKSPKTQARHLSSLKKFCAFAVKRAFLQENPTEGVTAPKSAAALPKALESKDIQTLLAYAQGEKPQQIRFLLILQLLYGGGLRVSEVLSIKEADINAEEETLLRITGKGDKTRLVPIGDVAAQTLEKYRLEARPHLGTAKFDPQHSEWLFPSPYKMGKPMTRQRFFQLVRAAGQEMGIAELSPHALRHTFATHLLQGDADLRAVQLLLGHANLATTQIYTKVVTDRLRSAVEQNHPLGAKNMLR